MKFAPNDSKFAFNYLQFYSGKFKLKLTLVPMLFNIFLTYL